MGVSRRHRMIRWLIASSLLLALCGAGVTAQKYYVGCDECFDGERSARFCLETEPGSRVQSPNERGLGVCAVGRTGDFTIKGSGERVENLSSFISCNRWITARKWCVRDCRVPKVSFCSMVDYPVDHSRAPPEELDEEARRSYDEYFRGLRESVVAPLVAGGMKHAYIGQLGEGLSGCESAVRQMICHKTFQHCELTGVCRSYGEAVLNNCKVMKNSNRVERSLEPSELPALMRDYESWPSPHDPEDPEECCCRRSWAVVASGDTIKYKAVVDWSESWSTMQEDGDFDFAATLEAMNYNDQSNAMRVVNALTTCHKSDNDAMPASSVIQLNQDDITHNPLGTVMFGNTRTAVAEILEDDRESSCPGPSVVPGAGRVFSASSMMRREKRSDVRSTLIPREAEFASVAMSVAGHKEQTFRLGPNVYAEPDYSDYKAGPRPNAATFAKVMLGDSELKSAGGRVLESGPEDRIMFIYLDHGSPPKLNKHGQITGNLDFLSGPPEMETNIAETSLTDSKLILLIRQMKQQMRFKSMALVIEACHSGAMFYRNVEDLEELNVVALTSAQPESAAFNDDTQRIRISVEEPVEVVGILFGKHTKHKLLLEGAPDYEKALADMPVTSKKNDKGRPLPEEDERSKPLTFGIVGAKVATTTNYFISFANVIETWIAQGQLASKTWKDLFEKAKLGHDKLVELRDDTTAEEEAVVPHLYGSRKVADEKLSCFWGAGANGKVPIVDDC